jgi:glycosyltransferase involved in cell wall biosynthesis
MRLGVVWEPNSAAHYRAIDPMCAMERRGHEIVWPADTNGAADVSRLWGCDVVHVYRRAAEDTQQALTQLIRGGTPITYDNDDDFTALPKESPDYKKVGGVKGRRIHAMTVKVAGMAHVFTTTNLVLEAKYRAAGVDRVEVIGNHLSPDAPRPSRRHDGVVIGWVGGIDHQADIVRIGIAQALEALIQKHGDVRVECIGVDLRLSQRYEHQPFVPFLDLPGFIGGWDIGIAPLADLPANRARSDIKVKEYAASGVPWLASPVGPYAGLGEAQGGLLVPDDRWFDVLDRLVGGRRERKRLARKAKTWAKSQTIEAVADRWEEVFAEAASRPTAPEDATGHEVAGRAVPA